MVLVIKSVTEISVEGVDIVKTWETGNDCGKTLRDCLLSELDFAHAVRQRRRIKC